jgi:CRISPR/Cas system-associated exonuclease Cas4 (RecB family)
MVVIVSEGLATNHRLLSFSEISRAMTCQAQWDFSYGGHLAGDALKPKMTAPRLSGGRAWGAAVSAYHVHRHGIPAIEAMDESLDADAARQRELGVHSQEAHDDLRRELLGLLNHYIHIADDFELDPLGEERELLVPIPSRTGGRSNRYKLLCYLDGTRMIDGNEWIVEFKLRAQLSSVEIIQLSRQIRYYAWAFWQATGIKPAGVQVHERLNQVPKPPRILQSGKPSHAKEQLCTEEAYRAVCCEHEVEVNEETARSLGSRRWQQVVPIMFRDGELEEAGRELVSAAKLIRDLDTGKLHPVRNAAPFICRGCSFKDICPSPDNELVDALFERTTPKRNRSSHEPA